MLMQLICMFVILCIYIYKNNLIYMHMYRHLYMYEYIYIHIHTINKLSFLSFTTPRESCIFFSLLNIVPDQSLTYPRFTCFCCYACY